MGQEVKFSAGNAGGGELAGGGGPAQSVTVKGTQQGGGWGRRAGGGGRGGKARPTGRVGSDSVGEGGKVRSENGGLVLGADGAL